MKSVKVCSLPVVLLLVSCAPSLTLEGSGVQVDPEATAECQLISAVEATGASEAEAEILLRNQAGAMNANRVILKDKLDASGAYRLRGQAYSCETSQ